MFILLQDESKTKQEETLKPESQLDLRVQELLKLICNVQTMEEMMIEMKYDTKRAPLGRTQTLLQPLSVLPLQWAVSALAKVYSKSWVRETGLKEGYWEKLSCYWVGIYSLQGWDPSLESDLLLGLQESWQWRKSRQVTSLSRRLRIVFVLASMGERLLKRAMNSTPGSLMTLGKVMLSLYLALLLTFYALSSYRGYGPLNLCHLK